MIKNILFDLGGVLIDCDLQAACDSFRKLGLENISDFLNLYCQNGFFYGIESGEYTRAQFNDRVREEIGKYVSDEDIDAAWKAIIKGVNLEKLHWIEKNRQNYKFYLLSNLNPYIFEWAETEAFSADKKPLHCYFDKMYISYLIKMTKPNHEIFNYVLSDAGIKAEETLYIDDGSKNIQSGKELGFATYQPQNGENWISAVEEEICRHK